MLPLLMLTVPPTTVGGGYFMWYCGQQVVLGQKQAPVSGALAYASGTFSGVGTYYGLQRACFPQALAGEKKTPNAKLNSGIDKIHVPPHKQSNAFQPPQSTEEIFQRMGRPLLMRLGAGGVALFCAGVAQTYVAAAQSP
jgi:hypothetical protein